MVRPRTWFEFTGWQRATLSPDALTLLPLTPSAGGRSTAAQEYSIAELPTRLSPSLPALVLRPVRAHRRAVARAAVFFSPAIPSSVSAVREFLLRCPLLTPHNSLVYRYCKRRTVTGW